MLWSGYFPVATSPSPEPTPDPEPTATYNLGFTIKGEQHPSSSIAIEGASVTVGEYTGGPTGNAGGCTVTGVEEGTYTLTVEADGYTTYTESITVDESHTSFNVVMTAEEITYTIVVKPDPNDPDPPSVIQDAVLVAMDSETMNTPFNTDDTLELQLKPGIYYLTIKSDSYGVETDTTLDVAVGDTTGEVYINLSNP